MLIFELNFLRKVRRSILEISVSIVHVPTNISLERASNRNTLLVVRGSLTERRKKEEKKIFLYLHNVPRTRGEVFFLSSLLLFSKILSQKLRFFSCFRAKLD
jgi:hypothetical protein